MSRCLPMCVCVRLCVCVCGWFYSCAGISSSDVAVDSSLMLSTDLGSFVYPALKRSGHMRARQLCKYAQHYSIGYLRVLLQFTVLLQVVYPVSNESGEGILQFTSLRTCFHCSAARSRAGCDLSPGLSLG